MSARTQPQRIALVYDGKGYGGAEVHLVRLLTHLDRARFEPHVVVAGRLRAEMSPTLIEKIQASGTPLHVTPELGPEPRGVRFARTVRMLRSLDCELAYVGTSTAIGLRLDLLALRLAGMRIVRLLHMPAASMKTFQQGHWSPWQVRQLDRLVALNLTVSDTDRAGLVREFGLREDRIEVCYHGLELERFVPSRSPAEARRVLGLDPQLPTVGLFGRFSHEKGHRFLIEAAPTILREAGNVQFALVGAGPLQAEIEAQIDQRELGPHFKLPGFQEDIRPWVEAADLVVMPSLFESAGLVMLECLALARPVVVSDLPSIRDHVSTDACVFVPAGDSAALAREVVSLLASPERRSELGRRGAELVRERFDLRRHVAQLMATFDRVLAGSRSRPAPRPRDSA